MRHLHSAALACSWALVVGVVVAMATGAAGAEPEQFEAWGTAGPAFPPVPEGWTEEPFGGQLPPPTPTPEEQARGYVLFARDPFELVYPGSVPAPSERAGELKTFCAVGEYEAMSFVLLALADLDEVRATVSDLRAAGGGVIPADHVDVRVVRCVRAAADAAAKTYRLVPWLLEKRASFAAPKGRSRQVWLTVKAPDDATPGDYAGTVRVQPTGREATELKVLVRVLPIRLPPAPVEMAMSHHPSGADDLLRRELVDLREHGMNAAVGSMGVEIETRDRAFGADDVEATRTRCKRFMDELKQVAGEWRSPVTFEVGHQIIYYWDQERGWFAHWEHSPALDDELLRAIRVVTDQAQIEGWPPLRAYVMDEAGAHSLLEEAAYYYRLVKERLPGLETYTTIGGGMAMGHDELGRLSPWVDFLSTNRFTEGIARSLVERGKPYGVYNGAGSTPAGARFFFGFYGWKTGARQILQWAYNFGQEAVFEGGGLRGEDNGFVYYAEDGPLPSIMFEAVREGVDDYRYVDLLWRAIAAAKASPKAAARTAGAEAEQSLTSLLGSIGWQYQAMDYADRTPPPHPSALRKWRWRVAQDILRLQAQLDGGGTVEAAQRPSPLDLPWAAAEGDEVVLGAELLPPSGFETDMKPWRVEAWKEAGSGELDATEAHSGGQSVRIEVPAGATSDAVTVLVWPSWGGGGLNVSLTGERTYEFSAWVKLRDRTMPPQLRVSVPGGAARTVRSGEGVPTPEGWRRVFTRIEMSGWAQPNYLAAWVQGPGTVWVDDLSLREVMPEPLSVTIDQAEYDSSDKLSVVSVTVSRRARPARLRCVLARLGGEVVGELAVPFTSQQALASAETQGAMSLIAPVALDTCRLVFDPSALVEGEYEVKVESVAADGTGVGTRSARFKRIAGPYE